MVRQYQRQYGEPYQRQYTQGITLPQLPQTDAPERMAQGIAQDAAKMAQELNSSAEKLYNNRFESAARQMVQEVYMKNPANPEALKTEFEAAFKGLTKDASPFMVDELRAKFDILTTPHITRATDAKIRLNTDALKESSLTLLNQSMKSLEQSAADMLNSNSEVAFQASRQVQYDMLTIEGQLNQNDELGSPLYPADFRVNFRDKVRSNMARIGLQRWFDEQPDKALALKQIKTGQKKFNFYDANGEISEVIDPTKEMSVHDFDKLLNRLERDVASQREASIRQQGISNLESSLNGDMVVDYKNQKQMALVDSYYQEKIEPIIANASPEEKIAAITEFAGQFKVLPTSIRSMLRTTGKSGTVEQQAFAGDLINRIAETTPDALDSIPDTEQRYSIMIGDSLRNGLSPEEAVQRAKTQVDPFNDKIIKERKSALTNIKKTYNPESRIINILDQSSWWVGGVNRPDLETEEVVLEKDGITRKVSLSNQAIADYQDIFDTEYLYTGDEEIAKKSAASIFQRTYGVTSVNGGQKVVRYPPEKYYAVKGLDNSWMREQLLSEVRSIPQYKDARDEDVILVPDSETARESSQGRPSYVVNVKQPDGSFDVVRNEDGALQRFTFDPSSYIEKHNQKIQEEMKEKVRDAKRARLSIKEKPDTLLLDGLMEY